MMMTTQYREWINRSRSLRANDVYAAYLMAYIGLVLFCREKYTLGMGVEEISIKRNPKLVSDYTIIFDNLSVDSITKQVTSKIASYFNTHGVKSLRYIIVKPNRVSPQFMKYEPGNFVSNLYYLKNVRNNMVHGDKGFEVRSEIIVNNAYDLLISLFDEVFIVK